MTAAQPYIAVSRRPLDLEDYINVARRHSGWIAGPDFCRTGDLGGGSARLAEYLGGEGGDADHSLPDFR